MASDMYKCESNYLKTEGEILTQSETEYYIHTYLKDCGFSDLVNLRFSNKFVAPTSVTGDKSGKSNINVALPIKY